MMSCAHNHTALTMTHNSYRTVQTLCACLATLDSCQSSSQSLQRVRTDTWLRGEPSLPRSAHLLSSCTSTLSTSGAASCMFSTISAASSSFSFPAMHKQAHCQPATHMEYSVICTQLGDYGVNNILVFLLMSTSGRHEMPSRYACVWA